MKCDEMIRYMMRNLKCMVVVWSEVCFDIDIVLVIVSGSLVRGDECLNVDDYYCK